MSEEDSAEDDSVPLEFGEEDEDLWNLATQDQQHPHPQPDDDNDNDNDNDEELWNSRDVVKMVEEMEKFDDISVVGLLDEEQQMARTLRNKSRWTAICVLVYYFLEEIEYTNHHYHGYEKNQRV